MKVSLLQADAGFLPPFLQAASLADWQPVLTPWADTPLHSELREDPMMMWSDTQLHLLVPSSCTIISAWAGSRGTDAAGWFKDPTRQSICQLWRWWWPALLAKCWSPISSCWSLPTRSLLGQYEQGPTNPPSSRPTSNLRTGWAHLSEEEVHELTISLQARPVEVWIC